MAEIFLLVVVDLAVVRVVVVLDVAGTTVAVLALVVVVGVRLT